MDKDFAAALNDVRTKLGYDQPLEEIHGDLVSKGWTAEEAHFLIRSAQLYPGV